MNHTKKRNLITAAIALIITAAVILFLPAMLTQEAHANGSDVPNSAPTSRPSGAVNALIAAPRKTPAIDGIKAMSWDNIANHIEANPAGRRINISLNDNFDVPASIQRAAKNSAVDVTFVVDETRRWELDHSTIDEPEDMDLRIALTGAIQAKLPRGVLGKQFALDGTNTDDAQLVISFGKDYIGQFVNIYKLEGDKLVYVKSVKADENGEAVLGLTEKGTYAAMLCEFSDLNGDANNDGMLTPADASAILRRSVDMIEAAANTKMADFNNDGAPTPADAVEILRRMVA